MTENEPRYQGYQVRAIISLVHICLLIPGEAYRLQRFSHSIFTPGSIPNFSPPIQVVGRRRLAQMGKRRQSNTLPMLGLHEIQRRSSVIPRKRCYPSSMAPINMFGRPIGRLRLREAKIRRLPVPGTCELCSGC